MSGLKQVREPSGQTLQHLLLRGLAVVLMGLLVFGRDRSIPGTALLLSTIFALVGIDQIPLIELTRSIDVRKTLLGRERFMTSPLGVVCQVLAGVFLAVHLLLTFFW